MGYELSLAQRVNFASNANPPWEAFIEAVLRTAIITPSSKLDANPIQPKYETKLQPNPKDHIEISFILIFPSEAKDDRLRSKNT